MSKIIYRDECCLFGILRKALLRDLIALGWPASVAGSLLKWFDPSSDAYLSRVSAWQESLCLGEIQFRALPLDVLAWIVKDPSCHHRDISTWYCELVQQIHQVCKLFYKFHGTCRGGSGLEAAKYRLSHSGTITASQEELRRAGNVLRALRPPSSWESLLGAYGPGITADRLSNFERWCRDGAFPARVPVTLFISSLDDYASIGRIQYTRYGITKIAEVPKSLKSNRIVSSEPANYQFAQKAVGAYLVREMRRRFPGIIDLVHSEKHNELLYQFPFVSIDLSDASDYISRRLVKKLFSPEWCEYLFSVRSTFARFPDGDVVPLRTFAPMGNGECFPVLSAVCLAAALIVAQHTVHVWGDDLICHLDDFADICDVLSRFGLIINSGKSAHTPWYRESCGLELFHSMVITPAYIRDDWVNVDASKLGDLVEKLTNVGFDATIQAILKECTPFRRLRWECDTQQQYVEVRVPQRARASRLPANHGLFRWHCTRAEDQRVVERKSEDRPLTWAYRPARDYPLLSYYIQSLDVAGRTRSSSGVAC